MTKSKNQTAGDKPKSKTEADLFAAFTDFCKVVFEGLTLPDKSGGRTVDCCYVETLNSKLAEISSSISIFLETDNTGGTDKRLWETSLMTLWFLSDNVRNKGTDSFYFEPNQKITAEKIARVENAWQLLEKVINKSKAQKIEGEWSNAMNKKEIMSKLGFGLRAYKKFETFCKDYPIRNIANNRELWQIRFDKMPSNLHKKFE
jgi:hypothetical protein